MRISLQPAFVLHHRPYRETSLIVDLFTRDYGRIAVVAKGVRTPKSRIRACLQPFNPLLITWQGKSELLSLSGAEGNGVPLRLFGDCLLSAFYINELLVRVLHKYDPHPKLYTIYQETLIELHHFKEGKLGLLRTLRIFEKKLLEELGYGLQLQYDISNGKPLIENQNYFFIPEQGFQALEDSLSSHRQHHWTFLGKSLLAFATEQLNDADCLRDAKRLMRLAIAPLLGNAPLHSRKLFIEVEKE